MANETKPRPDTAGTGARVGDANHDKQVVDAGRADPRGGASDENTLDKPQRGPSETKPPRRRL